jgi:hypothetical protein
MGLRLAKGDEKRLGPATTLEGAVALCHPERSRGICGSTDLRLPEPIPYITLGQDVRRARRIVFDFLP